MSVRYLTMGEGCLVVELGNVIDPGINEQVHRLAAVLYELEGSGIQELVPTYRSLAVYFDPLKVSRLSLKERVSQVLENIVSTVKSPASSEGRFAPYTIPRIVEIPVLYGGEEGPDLSFVAKYAGLSEQEVIEIHTSRIYRVYMLGFLPGFPYLGGLDERIAVPRLETPRTRIASGSVGIAGSQTGFYPMESPGGWRIMGRTPLKVFDPYATPPSLINPGDQVKFRSISRKEYEELERKGIEARVISGPRGGEE
ncbi:MAG: 5-oxoprolinase subunit PxpB [Spirochaetales bacterium]